MTLKQFVRKNRREIGEYILSQCSNCRVNDDERENWVLNDEFLYTWAREEGVKI